MRSKDGVGAYGAFYIADEAAVQLHFQAVGQGYSVNIRQCKIARVPCANSDGLRIFPSFNSHVVTRGHAAAGNFHGAAINVYGRRSFNRAAGHFKGTVFLGIDSGRIRLNRAALKNKRPGNRDKLTRRAFDLPFTGSVAFYCEAAAAADGELVAAHVNHVAVQFKRDITCRHGNGTALMGVF